MNSVESEGRKERKRERIKLAFLAAAQFNN